MNKLAIFLLSFALCLSTKSYAWIIKDVSSSVGSLIKPSEPDWVRNTPKTDKDYKYYVGRASAVKTEAEGMTLATRDAYEQALRMNFGTEFSFNNETFQTTNNLISQTQMVEKSKNVKFEDFELIEQYIKEEDKKWNVWVLYRFSKTAIEKEKERLKNIPKDENEEVSFSIQGSKSDEAKGILEIITQPKGMSVRIDGEAYGKTPLKLVGQLDLGLHKLQLNNDFYETEEQDIMIIPNKTTRINKKMTLATATINIDTVPPMANIIIDGIPAGISPIRNFKVEAGKNIKIEATHSEAFKIIQEQVFFKNTNETILLSMKEKPVTISFNSMLPNVDVYIDDNLIGSTPIERHVTTAGKHELSFKKKNYATKYDTIEVKGGENFSYPTFTLNTISEEERLEELEREREKEARENINKDRILNPWVFYIGYTNLGKTNEDFDNGTGGIELQFAKRFNEYIGIRGGIYFGNDKTSENDSSYTPIFSSVNEEGVKDVSAFDFNLAMPIYLPLTRQHSNIKYSYPGLSIYFGPEIGITKSDFKYYNKYTKSETYCTGVIISGTCYGGTGTRRTTYTDTENFDISQGYYGFFAGIELGFGAKENTAVDGGINVEFGTRSYKAYKELEGSDSHSFRIAYFFKF